MSAKLIHKPVAHREIKLK